MYLQPRLPQRRHRPHLRQQPPNLKCLRRQPLQLLRQFLPPSRPQQMAQPPQRNPTAHALLAAVLLAVLPVVVSPVVDVVVLAAVVVVSVHRAAVDLAVLEAWALTVQAEPRAMPKPS